MNPDTLFYRTRLVSRKVRAPPPPECHKPRRLSWSGLWAGVVRPPVRPGPQGWGRRGLGPAGGRSPWAWRQGRGNGRPLPGEAGGQTPTSLSPSEGTFTAKLPPLRHSRVCATWGEPFSPRVPSPGHCCRRPVPLLAPWASGRGPPGCPGRQRTAGACGTGRGSRRSPQLAGTPTLPAQEGSPRTRRKGSNTGP